MIKVIVYQPKTAKDDPELDKKILFTKEMTKGAGFGELALIYNDKRSATIIAMEECETFVLDGVLFKQMIIQSTMQKRTNHAGFLNQIKLFDSLEKQQKLRLVDGLVQITFAKDEFVFKEGDEGLEFFIIEKGEVECLKNGESETDELKSIRKLNSGDHFGELALINNDQRSLSVRAAS